MRILITGASGQLGSYLLRHLQGLDCVVMAWTGTQQGDRFGVPLQPVELSDFDALRVAFAQAKPDAIIHAGAMARVDECHRNPERAFRVNAEAARVLAEQAVAQSVRFIQVSTDMVFDGEQAPYRESDAPTPLSVYGRSKAEAEAALSQLPGVLVVRVALMFGPSLNGRATYFDHMVATLRLGHALHLFGDEWRTPISYAAAATALEILARAEVTGVLHLGGPERLSRLEMGLALAERLGMSASSILPVGRNQTPGPEPRPRDLSLDSSRWRELFPSVPWPGFRESLQASITLSEKGAG